MKKFDLPEAPVLSLICILYNPYICIVSESCSGAPPSLVSFASIFEELDQSLDTTQEPVGSLLGAGVGLGATPTSVGNNFSFFTQDEDSTDSEGENCRPSFQATEIVAAEARLIPGASQSFSGSQKRKVDPSAAPIDNSEAPEQSGTTESTDDVLNAEDCIAGRDGRTIAPAEVVDNDRSKDEELMRFSSDSDEELCSDQSLGNYIFLYLFL